MMKKVENEIQTQADFKRKKEKERKKERKTAELLAWHKTHSLAQCDIYLWDFYTCNY